MGYTRCPATCEADPTLSAEENKQLCMCKVPDEYIEKYGAKYILEDSDLLAKVRVSSSFLTFFFISLLINANVNAIDDANHLSFSFVVPMIGG